MSEALLSKEEKVAFIEKLKARVAEHGVTPAEYLVTVVANQICEVCCE